MPALPRLQIPEARRKWWVLVTMTGALSMILIDQTVVSVALPTIQRDLDMSQTELQWVVNAYMLSLAALVAVGGRVGDSIGRARAFNLGALVFIAASAASGLAQSDAWIIAARAVQGIGAALMVPASMAIVTNAFGPEERGRAMGIYAGISMIFLALGPLIGGVLTEAVTWRAVFWINLPFGLAMVALSLVTLTRDRPPPAPALDLPGLATLVAGLTALVLALMQSQTWGWGSEVTIALLAGGALLLVAFVVIETRVAGPLLDLRVLRNRNFATDSSVLFFISFGLVGLTVFGAIWIQNVLDFSPIEAGLSLLPLTLVLLVVAPLSGRIYDRVGPRLLVGVGAAIGAGGLAWSAIFLDRESYAWLVPGYLAIGLGMGMVMTPTNTDAMNAAAAELRGQASGVLQALRQIGGTVGLAVIGTVVATIQRDRIDDFLAAEPAGAEHAARVERLLSEAEEGQRSALSEISPRVLDAASDALTTAIGAGYYVGAGVLALASVAAFALLRRVRPSDLAPGEPAPEPDDAAAAHPAV